MDSPALWSRRLFRGFRRHAVVIVVFLAGLGLRVATQFTYRPAILYYDSYGYLADAVDLQPNPHRPLGYSVFMRPFLALDDLAVLALLNHVMALGLAALIYVALLRRGVRRWLAALAVAPVLLSAYHLVVEQMIMSDVLFEALVVGGAVALVWRRRPGYLAAVCGGGLFALATTVRLVGQPLILAGAVYLLVVDGRLRRRLATAGAFVLAFALPLTAYAGYNALGRGAFELTSRGPESLYARAAMVADCDTLSLPAYERQLCPRQMDVEPLKGSMSDAYFFRAHAMTMRPEPPPGISKDEALRDFSMRVIRGQPVDVARAIGGDFLRGFTWQKTRRPGELPIERWRFQTVYPTYGGGPGISEAAVDYYGGYGPAVNLDLAGLLRSYQLTVGYVPGPLLFAALLAGLAGATGLLGRRWSDLHAASLLWTTTGAGLVLTGDVFQFSWRYQLPAIVFLPAAGALGLTALAQRRARRIDTSART